MQAAIKQLETKLDYRFSNHEGIEAALTHRSYTIEHPEQDVTDNERLEFVGDAVLGLSIANRLHAESSRFNEGTLSKFRAAIVCEPTLADAARNLGLGDLLRLGHGEDKSGGRDRDSNLSNALEAVFAAIFLDGGFEAAQTVVLTVMKPYYDLALSGQLLKDYKSRLLELAQSFNDWPKLQFVIIDASGPVHERLFTAEVRLGEQVLGTGQGKSKKQAEQQAARAAFESIKTESME